MAEPQLSVLRRLVCTVLHPAVQAAVVLWLAASVAALFLAKDLPPFDRPALANMSFAQQVAFPSLGLLEIFALMAVVYTLTSRRVIPNLAGRVSLSTERYVLSAFSDHGI
jgi:hypothetical protein